MKIIAKKFTYLKILRDFMNSVQFTFETKYRRVKKMFFLPINNLYFFRKRELFENPCYSIDDPTLNKYSSQQFCVYNFVVDAMIRLYSIEKAKRKRDRGRFNVQCWYFDSRQRSTLSILHKAQSVLCVSQIENVFECQAVETFQELSACGEMQNRGKLKIDYTFSDAFFWASFTFLWMCNHSILSI